MIKESNQQKLLRESLKLICTASEEKKYTVSEKQNLLSKSRQTKSK